MIARSAPATALSPDGEDRRIVLLLFDRLPLEDEIHPVPEDVDLFRDFIRVLRIDASSEAAVVDEETRSTRLAPSLAKRWTAPRALPSFVKVQTDLVEPGKMTGLAMRADSTRRLLQADYARSLIAAAPASAAAKVINIQADNVGTPPEAPATTVSVADAAAPVGALPAVTGEVVLRCVPMAIPATRTVIVQDWPPASTLDVLEKNSVPGLMVNMPPPVAGVLHVPPVWVMRSIPAGMVSLNCTFVSGNPALGFVTVIVAMEVPLSATTVGLKLLVMTAEEACANAVPVNDALISAAMTIARRNEL